jgi:hypothetical protein
MVGYGSEGEQLPVRHALCYHIFAIWLLSNVLETCTRDEDAPEVEGSAVGEVMFSCPHLIGQHPKPSPHPRVQSLLAQLLAAPDHSGAVLNTPQYRSVICAFNEFLLASDRLLDETPVLLLQVLGPLLYNNV